MKKRSILLTGLTCALTLGAAIGLTACGGHTHSIDAVAQKDATCTEAGYEAYYKCTDCDKIFADAEGTVEISVPVAIPAGHHIEQVAKKSATCGEAGYEAHYKCTTCGTLFSDAAGEHEIEAATVIPKLTTHTIEAVSQKRATCTEDGYEEHFKCTVCGTLFEDEDGAVEIDEPVAIPAAHRIVAVDQKDPTCIEAGYEAHYECSICNVKFADKDGATEIDEPTPIAATGIHTYDFDYTSETLPTPVAEGGTLPTTCIHCGAHGETAYDKGIVDTNSASAPTRIEESGTYYYNYPIAGLNVAIKATKAGTYTFTILSNMEVSETVNDSESLYLSKLSIGAYALSTSSKCIIRSSKWNTLSSAKALVEKWQQQIEIGDFGEAVTASSLTISITILEEDFDFDADDVYINISLVSHISSSADTNGVLFSVGLPE